MAYQDRIVREARNQNSYMSDYYNPQSASGQAAEKVVQKGRPRSEYDTGRSSNLPTKSVLRFPSNLGTEATQLNYMQFTLKEISSASAPGGGTRGADPRNLVFKKAYGYPTICLPIPAGINQAYQQNWQESQVAGRHAMLAEQGAAAINAVGEFVANRSTGGISGIVNRIKDSTLGATSPVEGENLLQRAGRFIGNTTAELGGMALTSNIVELGDIARAGQYSAGLRMIDQAMLSYGGPGFRAFQYNFSLKPNSEEESGTIYSMTQAMKQFSAPNQRSTKYTRVYDLPGVFKIQFFWNGHEHPSIGKIGHCALTNINIRYGGDKFTTFAGTHTPVQWDVTLDFKELELLNRDAIMTEKWGGSNWPNYSPHRSNVDRDISTSLDDEDIYGD